MTMSPARLRLQGRVSSNRNVSDALLERVQRFQCGVGKQDSAKSIADDDCPARLFVQLPVSWSKTRFNLNSSVEHLTQRCREAESAESISSFENTISYDSNPHEGSHHLKDDATTNSGNCDNASNSHFPPHSQPLCGSA